MDGFKYRLIIFDWDGTLSDSAAQIVSSMQRAVAALDLPPRADDDFRQMIGLSFEEGLGRVYPDHIATGKSRVGLDRSLQHHRAVRRLVHATRTADETANKPHPLMLEELLARFEVPVSEALMVGDTEFDVAMARALGMDAVGVTCGVHPPERLVAAGALALLPDVAALSGWLGAAL